MTRGIVLQGQENGDTAPLIVCESCGERIQDVQLAWVMWRNLQQPDQSTKPAILCKKNHCNAKPEYADFASMELRDFLIDLCRNVGMRQEKDFHEALEMAHLADQL